MSCGNSGTLVCMQVVGIDEVGRGCWAGPVVAGAVLLPSDFVLSDGAVLRDSKLMTKPQRELADRVIREQATSIGLGWVAAQEIDTIGLTAAVGLAMKRALEQITNVYDEVIIDGNLNFLADHPLSRAIIKADASVPAVSAASIVAKVARDRYMVDIAERYPNYGFEKHVGYGTREHQANLQVHGVSEMHRRSFRPVKAVLAL